MLYGDALEMGHFWHAENHFKVSTVHASSVLLVLIAGVSIFLGFSISCAQAIAYYVAPDGNNQNAGTSDQPWRAPAYGADQLQPGDTLVIKAGQYILSDFGEDMISPPSGQSDAWITIKGEDGVRPVLVGTNNLYAAIVLSSTSYVKIENLEIRSDGTNPFRDGINSWDPAAHIVLENLYIHHLDEFGINLRDIDDLKINNSTIEYCGFGAVGGSAGAYGGWQNILIHNCTLSYGGHYYQGTPGPSPYDRPDGFGIEPSQGPIEISDTMVEHNRGDGLDSKADNTSIHHCIVAHNFADGIKLWGQNSRVENCLVFDTGDGITTATPWSGLVIGTRQINAEFEIINTAIVDNPLRHNYPVHVQYDDRDVSIQLLMRNCIISHGYGSVYIGPSVTFISDHNLFYRPGEDIAIQVGDRGYTNEEVESGMLGPGNLARDPIFVSWDFQNTSGFELQEGSCAIDAGVSQGAPSDDLYHRLRPEGTGYDLGPFERQSESPTAPTVSNSDGASNITCHSAILNGEVTDTGGEAPAAYIYWGDNDGGTEPDLWDHVVSLGTMLVGTL
jgi:hypothetical protein